ncbi:MAG: hypothetical protein ACYC96_03890 [Fimbriimonadaceae bacterium]
MLLGATLWAISFSFDGGSAADLANGLASLPVHEAVAVAEVTDIRGSLLGYPKVRARRATLGAMFEQLHRAIGDPWAQPKFAGFNQGLMSFRSLIAGMSPPPTVKGLPAPHYTGFIAVDHFGYATTTLPVVRMSVSAIEACNWSKKLSISPVFASTAVDFAARHVREESALRCLATSLGCSITETESAISLVPNWYCFQKMAIKTCITASRADGISEELRSRLGMAAALYAEVTPAELKSVFDDRKSVRRRLVVTDQLRPELVRHLGLELKTMNAAQRRFYETNIDVDRVIFELKPFSCPIIGFKGRNGMDIFI